MADAEIRRLEERLSRIEQRLDRLFQAMGLPTTEDLDRFGETQPPPVVPLARAQFGYEYRSAATWMGLPLIHVATGVDPRTWRPRVAKGWIAQCNIAVGGLAIGGMAFGGICLGGLALGLLALGGLGVGLLAFGGAAIGYVTVGGGAIGYWALGGGAAGVHVVAGNYQDPAAVEFFGRYLPGLIECWQPGRGESVRFLRERTAWAGLALGVRGKGTHGHERMFVQIKAGGFGARVESDSAVWEYAEGGSRAPSNGT